MQVSGGRRIRRASAVMVTMVVAGSLSCTPAFINNTASLGGDTPGSRGNVQVQFVNNTPFRAIFTYGVYDPQDSETEVQFEQFFVDVDSTRLEGNTTTEVVTFQCGRALSVGGDRLIQLIEDRELEGNPAALQPGIAFSSASVDSDDANQPTAGRSPGVVTLQGVEFQCDSLLVYTFNVDPSQPSGFRIDLQVVLP